MNQQEERDEVRLKWNYLPVHFLPQLYLTQTSYILHLLWILPKISQSVVIHQNTVHLFILLIWVLWAHQ